MQILIVSATLMEIAPLQQQKPALQYLVTGVGAPACMYTLQEKLHQNSYDLVIQAGIGGCFDSTIPLSTVYGIEKDVFADAGIFENGALKTLFEAGLADPNQSPFSDGWLVNKSTILSTIHMPLAGAITVNRVSENEETNLLYKAKYQPMIESMEGAAFHYVCIQQKIPFLQIRSLSNYVGERDKTKWKMQASIQSLNESLVQIVDSLN